MRRVELLAPAGTFDALVAAVQNGADAVYIGGSRFGARAFAGNFSDDEIVQAVRYAHIRDVKVYVTVNTLIRDADFEECIAFIDFLYRHDVDAIILQDVGLASYVHRYYPDFEIHASTQMSIANTEEARYYQSLGFSRVVVARENSIDEIRRIYDQTGLEIEAFVHGALCVSYSGKCLFSYVNGGRSSNQGACAQPCRKKYTLEQDPAFISPTHFLSTKDLCSIHDLEKIVSSGVYSLKIEGRMKRPEYVATVVRNYRKALDALSDNQTVDLEALEWEMKSVFNREFTKGLLLSTHPKELVNKETPHNIGVAIGKVTRVDTRNKKLDLLLSQRVNKGDGLSLGEHIGRMFVGNRLVESADAKETITIDFVGKATVGETVRKTSDKQLIKRATDSLKQESVKADIFAKVTIHRDEKPCIEAWDNRGNRAMHSEDELTQLAMTKSVTKEELLAQLMKTEGEPFHFVSVDIDLEEGLFIKKSTLNALRRNILNKMADKRAILYPKRKPKESSFVECTNEISERIEALSPSMLSVKCTGKDQIDACYELQVGHVYTPHVEDYLYATGLGMEAFLMTPVMLKDHQLDPLKEWIEDHQPNVLTTGLGFAHWVNRLYQEKNIKRKIRLDYYFNAYNLYTFSLIRDLGWLDSVTVSLEHPSLQFGDFSGLPNFVEFPLYIHPMLMVTEFCPYKKEKPCATCRIDNRRLLSEDKKVKVHLQRDWFCRMQLMDSKAMDFSSRLEDAKSQGITKYRIDLLQQNKAQTKEIILGYLGKKNG